MRGFLGYLMVSAVLVFPGSARGQIIEFVEIFKGVDRSNGQIVPIEPYFIEICVEGPDLINATVEPPGKPLELLPVDGSCFDAAFDTLVDLNLAFPNGTYLFRFNSNTDGIQVPFTFLPPDGFPAITSPPDGASDIDPDVNLPVSWSIDPASCPSMNVANCGAGIQLFLVDNLSDMDVYQNDQIGITETGDTVQAADLNPGTPYTLEVETYNGVIDQADVTISGGLPVSVSAIFEDINAVDFMTLPEPGGAALGAAALAVVSLLGRRRGRR